MKGGLAGLRTGGDRERGRADTRVPVEEIVQLAAFTLDGEHYAIDIMRIKEIITPLPITPVPRAPAFIEGVVHQQRGPGLGVFLPVVDMRKRFERPRAEPTRATKYLLVAVDAADARAATATGAASGPGPAAPPQRWIVGLIVDSVREVLRVKRSEILAPPAMALSGEARYFSGVCRPRKDGPIVMIVDLEELLSPGERAQLGGLGRPA